VLNKKAWGENGYKFLGNVARYVLMDQIRNTAIGKGQNICSIEIIEFGMTDSTG
jgi:hypothetical protein